MDMWERHKKSNGKKTPYSRHGYRQATTKTDMMTKDGTNREEGYMEIAD